jgi:hypothetical protein
MAGFEVIIYGRFWVITEVRSRPDGGLHTLVNPSA